MVKALSSIVAEVVGLGGFTSRGSQWWSRMAYENVTGSFYPFDEGCAFRCGRSVVEAYHLRCKRPQTSEIFLSTLPTQVEKQ